MAGKCLRLAESERDAHLRAWQFAGVSDAAKTPVEGTPEGAFSLNLIYDRALRAGRLWGLRHDGEWFHVGTPKALKETEEAFHVMNFLAVHR